MFSFRKKPKEQDSTGPHLIRASPSLPQLTAQGIPWPESLVDISTLEDLPTPQHPIQGAAKTSFHGPDRTPIAFHKPLWLSSPGNPAEPPSNGHGPISKLYLSGPPSAFEARKSSSYGRPRPGQRRPRIPPTFNVMVAGGQGTGKTSLLRLLLETADISPTATSDQKAALEKFLRQRPKRTTAIQAACVEICESRYDRVLLSVVDTPGLDFHESRALKLDRQVSGIIKYLDTQYANTLNEEAKVVRQSQTKGDQHIHLCIYMIDPTSVMSASARQALSSLPTMTRSETTISYRPPDLSSVSDGTSSDVDDDEGDDKLTMSPAELRIIRRLTTRANVLPVIARADSLTDDRLTAVKRAVHKELHDAGLDFGVFGPPGFDYPPDENGHGPTYDPADDPDGKPNEDGERKSRPVIKLRANRHPVVGRSRSRSRRDFDDTEDPLSPDTDSVANVRFSARIIAKMDLSDVLPFALIAPEQVQKKALKPPSHSENGITDNESSVISPSEDGHSLSNGHGPLSPIERSKVPYLQGPPADLKGVFLRKFRWGVVDVLDPNHCDFAALRTAVLSTHMKLLKTRTKEVLYEKYRTEKLLAKRATRNISEEDAKKLLEDVAQISGCEDIHHLDKIDLV